MLSDFWGWVMKCRIVSTWLALALGLSLRTQPSGCQQVQTITSGEPTWGNSWRRKMRHQLMTNIILQPPSLHVFQLRPQISWSKDKLSLLFPSEFLTCGIYEHNYFTFLPVSLGKICHMAIVTGMAEEKGRMSSGPYLGLRTISAPSQIFSFGAEFQATIGIDLRTHGSWSHFCKFLKPCFWTHSLE